MGISLIGHSNIFLNLRLIGAFQLVIVHVASGRPVTMSWCHTQPTSWASHVNWSDLHLIIPRHHHPPPSQPSPPLLYRVWLVVGVVTGVLCHWSGIVILLKDSPCYVLPQQFPYYCQLYEKINEFYQILHEGRFLSSSSNYVITKPITERWEMYPNLIMTLSQHFLSSAEWAVWLLIISVRVRRVRSDNFNNILQLSLHLTIIFQLADKINK